MKRIYIIIVFITLVLTANAQKSIYRYPQPGLIQGDIYIIPMMGGASNWSFKYISDTVISDTTYSLFSSKESSPYYYYYTLYDSGKVYSVGRDSNGSLSGYKRLQYDFSLGLNDTFHCSGGYYAGNWVVDSVSTITLLNGQTRKYMRLFLSGINNHFQWVDGIGDIDNGFFYNAGGEGEQEEFVCQRDSSGLVWVNNSVSMNCDSLTSFPADIKPMYSNNFQLYPTPTTDNLTIEVQQNAVIKITNIQGQLVKTLATKSNKTSIDISSLAKGVYVLKATTEKGLEVRKFIKE